MSDTIIVQYLGFEVQASVRMYKFLVRETATEPREFTLAIANEAFDSHRARFQDAPDICSLKLRHELAESSNHPPKSQFNVSDAELDVYSSAHWKKSQRNPYSHKPHQDS
ncbi:MAG: hypothetical protein HY234_03010 [Acidobacteria bacterium]|nr:hypothetical protein [Acidobacteriota bacterium]MBI3662006.1 hypothetical protein [Acidobacteriota bacterium]